MGFLPANYELPTGSSTGSYTKIEKGETKLRILSEAITGWVYWTDDDKPKPVRSKEFPGSQPQGIQYRDGKPTRVRHFWAFVVWNYKTNQIEICELTQRTIQDALVTLVEDSDWGDPTKYDIKITRAGDGLETSYTVIGNPKFNDPQKEIMTAFKDANIDLEAMLRGEDPFGEKKESKPKTNGKPAVDDDIPF